MSHKNPRRKNRDDVALRHEVYHNGYSTPAILKKDGEEVLPSDGFQRVGKTRFLDKSLHGWHRKSDFADVFIGASIGNDFSNGHRGMAKAVKGAKKFVRTRIRFHEKAKVNQMLKEGIFEDE